VGIEYVECDTLSELVEFLKNFKVQSTNNKKTGTDSTSHSSQSSELGWNDGEGRIIVLTKQPSVMEKFCADNEIEARIHAWKLGGPSFVMSMNNEK
jgi:hypothetical protein